MCLPPDLLPSSDRCVGGSEMPPTTVIYLGLTIFATSQYNKSSDLSLYLGSLYTNSNFILFIYSVNLWTERKRGWRREISPRLPPVNLVRVRTTCSLRQEGPGRPPPGRKPHTEVSFRGQTWPQLISSLADGLRPLAPAQLALCPEPKPQKLAARHQDKSRTRLSHPPVFLL